MAERIERLSTLLVSDGRLQNEPGIVSFLIIIEVIYFSYTERTFTPYIL